MSTRVVGGTGGTFFCIYTSHHRNVKVFGQFFGDMDRKLVFLLGVNDFNGFEFAYDHPCITYLTTTFGIERSIAQYNLIQCLVFLLDLAIAQDAGFIFGKVITYKVGVTFLYGDPVAGFNGCRVTGAFFLFLHFGVELFFVYSHAVFSENQFCQVEGETESVI